MNPGLLPYDLAQFFPEFLERLGDDADIRHDGDEVCIAAPSRNDVQVHMILEAGAGGLADVDADV